METVIEGRWSGRQGARLHVAPEGITLVEDGGGVVGTASYGEVTGVSDNVYAIDVLARRGYLTMSLRGLSGTPARTVLGQRALNRPTILVTNQHSLSDAEDFAEGDRTLRLGQIVGEPTAGWIIYTWNLSLIDGTNFRLPRMKVTGNDGAVMERNPRPVDIEVTRPIGETLTEKDSQLDVAVRELLKQLGASRSTSPR